jgi:tocopherol O-methyltransferase
VTSNATLNDSVRDQEGIESLTRYYDDTWLDYRLVWLNRENLALHFGYYDDQHRRHRKALANMNRVLADFAGVRAEQRVLDAGCGVGGSSFWLAEERGAKVVGITPVQSQVDRANAVARQRGLEEHVKFKREDYRNCSQPDASFDVVWALESLCHAPVKAAAYAEFFRVLKPGGTLVIAEYIRSGRQLASASERALSEWLTSWAIPDIDTSSEHQSAAEAAGFRDFIARDVTRHTRRSLWRLYVASYLGIPIDKALRRLGLRNDVHEGNVVGSRRQFESLRRGDWFYGIITAKKPVSLAKG